MSDSFERATGRKVVSLATAQEVGDIAHLLVDTERRTVAALVIGKGKRAKLVDWAQVTGFGPDAVMVSDDAALRAPENDRERLAASGALELVGKRVSARPATDSARSTTSCSTRRRARSKRFGSATGRSPPMRCSGAAPMPRC